jgi:hypothetical protein
MTHPIQQIGSTTLLVVMNVEEDHEAEFDRWYNEEHLWSYKRLRYFCELTAAHERNGQTTRTRIG